MHKDLQTRIERLLSGDVVEIGYVHEGLGIVASSLGQQHDALKHIHTALTIYERSELVSEMARVCSNLGAVYMIKGAYKAAKEYMYRSLELAERVGDLPNVSFVTLNLGEVALHSGDLPEAERLLKQSLALNERINYREGISWCSTILATAQQRQGKLQEAAQNILRALHIGRAIKSTRCIRFTLIWLADLRITQAITLSQRAFSSREGNQQYPIQQHRMLLRAKFILEKVITFEGVEVEYIIEGKFLLAHVYFLLDDNEAAQQIAQQILKEALEYETINVSGRVYRLLGLIQAAQGYYAQANHYFEQAIQICREQELQLEYARALHCYGATLTQNDASPLLPHESHATTRPSTHKQTYQKGLDCLHEARNIFATCHATIDLSLVERDLATLSTTHSL